MTWRRFFFALALVAGLAWSAAAQESERPGRRAAGPLVVELYTSQNCNTCARANRLVGELGREESEVIALTFSVDYWDYLGWRDTFAHTEFTRRQREYRRALGARGLYTPEVVINGAHNVNGARAEQVRELLAEVRSAPPRAGPRISVAREQRRARVEIGRAAAPAEPADVWVVSFDPGPVWQTVGAGSRLGTRVPHYNLVRNLEKVGQWTGEPVTFNRVSCLWDCAVLVQAPRGGPILAAARTPPRRPN
jgi:hypothetical protein